MYIVYHNFHCVQSTHRCAESEEGAVWIKGIQLTLFSHFLFQIFPGVVVLHLLRK